MNCSTGGECPEAEGCPLCNTRRWSLKFYDMFEPLRDLLTEFPELREEIVRELGRGMTQSFAGNFYAGRKP